MIPELPAVTECLALSLRLTAEELREFTGIPAARFSKIAAGEAEPTAREAQLLLWTAVLALEGIGVDPENPPDWSELLGQRRKRAPPPKPRKAESRLAAFLR